MKLEKSVDEGKCSISDYLECIAYHRHSLRYTAYVMQSDHTHIDDIMSYRVSRRAIDLEA